MISLIACIGHNHELGKNGALIFHLRDDLQFFRKTTSGHKVIMGRKTWDSLPNKLENRENIVISHQNFPGPDRIVHDIESLISAYRNSDEEVFIIGGGTIYAKFLSYATHLYLTEVDASTPDADTFFPEFDRSEYSKELIKQDKEANLAYSIFKYTKNKEKI